MNIKIGDVFETDGVMVLRYLGFLRRHDGAYFGLFEVIEGTRGFTLHEYGGNDTAIEAILGKLPKEAKRYLVPTKTHINWYNLESSFDPEFAFEGVSIAERDLSELLILLDKDIQSC